MILVAVCLAAGAGVGINKGEIKDFWIGEAGRAEAIATAGGLTPATDRADPHYRTVRSVVTSAQ